MNIPRLDRRVLLKRTAAAAGASLLAGCDRLSNARWFRRTLETGEDANLFVQRRLLSLATLAFRTLARFGPDKLRYVLEYRDARRIICAAGQGCHPTPKEAATCEPSR